MHVHMCMCAYISIYVYAPYIFSRIQNVCACYPKKGKKERSGFKNWRERRKEEKRAEKKEGKKEKEKM